MAAAETSKHAARGVDYAANVGALPAGDADAGEIELLTSPADLAGLDAVLRARGVPDQDRRIGVVYEDAWVVLFRDPVRFPSGALGTYLRLVLRPGLTGDAGTITVVRRGQEFLFKRVFRHATRSWEFEFPRGFRAEDAGALENALVELAEEAGAMCIVEPARVVGRLVPDSGLTGHHVAVVLVDVVGEPGTARPERSEAIDPAAFWWTREDVASAIRDGDVQDGFTLAAWAIVSAAG